MMKDIIKVNAGSKFEVLGSYSRAVAVDNWIYVSLTAGRNPDTKEIPEDAVEQAVQVFRIIEKILASLGSFLADVVMSRVFVQSPEHVNAVMGFIAQKFKGINPATTITCPPLGSTVYKVEVEVTAYRDASNLNKVSVELE